MFAAWSDRRERDFQAAKAVFRKMPADDPAYEPELARLLVECEERRRLRGRNAIAMALDEWFNRLPFAVQQAIALLLCFLLGTGFLWGYFSDGPASGFHLP